MDLDTVMNRFRYLNESKLISLITQLLYQEGSRRLALDSESIAIIIEIIHVVRSMDSNSQPKPKPESKLMSLVTQTISLFNSMDLDSLPNPLSKLLSVITPFVNSSGSDLNSFSWEAVQYLPEQIFELKPEPELMSLIHQIFSIVISMNSKSEELISLAPQRGVRLEKGKFHVVEEVPWKNNNKWECLPLIWEKLSLRKGEDTTHFLRRGWYGKNHEEYENDPVGIKHPLHPKHSLQLVLLTKFSSTRECYCCDEDLIKVFYYCSVCDYAMNIACVDKQPVLSIDHPKWHEHTLSHFPRQASLTCDVCALAHSSSPFYICLLCDFVIHQSCINLPRLIRISRHVHRISFTPSFDQGELSCGVCRRKVDNHYGGFSCIKDGCSYAAHSRCATQSNVWDGVELEGKPEEIEEEVEPFVRISDGIIQHFSHQQHHLRLDENSCKDYDDNKQCQACITPIYFGNFYSCMQCDFILHKECANLSRKIHHPIHPHMLTLALVERNDRVVNEVYRCLACPRLRTTGFFYKCYEEEECDFELHVQCATIFEPLVHGSHMHPLFLTSKPGEQRTCSVCVNDDYTETFNCIDCECDFALCFGCATIPQKVRYKHDKHMLTLSYAHDETYWCEACEGEIKPKERFYKCDKYCCVTLHIECLIGKDLYMKPGSSWFHNDEMVSVLPNNHMSRPICYKCKKHSPYKIVFQFVGSVFCTISCLYDFAVLRRWMQSANLVMEM